MTRTKYHTFEDFAPAEFAQDYKGKAAAQLMFMYRKVMEKSNPVILELGTAKGTSTTVFLQACEEKDGRLVSVDIEDCSDISDSSRWQFVQADSTDVNLILKEAPLLKNGIDILYIDSLHTRGHVEKELTGWYPYLKEQSWIFFDDVDSNPYRKGNRKDNFKAEVAWDSIHEYVKEFYYANEDSIQLNIFYGSTGLASMYKLSSKGTLPYKAKSIIHRDNNLLNRMRYNLLFISSAVKRRFCVKLKKES